MKTDSRRDLDITYNYLNLVSQVNSIDGPHKVKYTYSADGKKLSAKDAAGNGYDYLGSLIYQTTTAGQQLELAQFKEGVIKPNDGVDYFLRDHLGSTRVVANLAANDIVQQRNDYYPFGMKHEPANGAGIAASTNRFLFSGKELQTTGNLKYLDFGARKYDAMLGRWHVNDPLLEKYLSISPMAYCGNNPIVRVELDGKVWINKNNQVIYQNGKYTSAATSQDRTLGNELRSTKTGAEQFDKLVNGGARTAITVSQYDKSKEYGLVQPLKNKTGEAYGNEIVLYEKATTEFAKKNGLKANQSMSATLGHEIEHTTPENIQQQKESNTKGNNSSNTPAKDLPEEKKPAEVKKKIIEEYEELNKKR